VLLNGLNGIAGASGGESTRWRKQRRDTCPIEIDGEQEKKGKERGEHGEVRVES